MITTTDCFGRTVRLTEERLAHILERAEMHELVPEVIRTLQAPSEVRISRSDADVQLFYEFYRGTAVGDK